MVRPRLLGAGHARAERAARARPGRSRSWRTLGSRSSVIFDLDNDGDLDIVTNDFNSAPQVLVSNLAAAPADPLAEGRSASGRRRIATGSARPCGSRPAAASLTQWNDGKSGYLSQSVLPLYFGLGDATKIDRVEVDWPSGASRS